MNDSQIRASLHGLALGDALGAPVEFLRVDEILKKWPPAGPTAPPGPVYRVTDDTQMAIAVGDALCFVRRGLTPASFAAALNTTFVRWYQDPENNRAPGNTCLSACEALERGEPWLEATVQGSKGCGANMRVTPVGLLARIDETTRAGAAQLQAAMTHGHPTGLAASDLTAQACAWLVSGTTPQELPEKLRDYAESQRRVYHEAWLGRLWERPGGTTPQHFIERGWEEVIACLQRLDVALKTPRPEQDPCIATGDGWIAEEALTTALHAFLLFPDEPLRAIGRGAVTRGDSDSIACLAGAFAGAWIGESAWPLEWVQRLEYLNDLDRIAAKLAA